MRREIVIISLLALLQPVFGKGGLCEVETGQSNIIMDIEESRGTEIGQETSPVELPIRGDPFTEVQLELSFPKGHPLFILNGRKLQLLQPLDRDKDNLSHIVFQVTCTIRGTSKKRTIPVIVRVSDVNDNAPEFINTPYEVSISELSPVGTTVFTGLKATDPDAGANGLVEYRVVPGRVATGRSNERLAVADGSQYFAINLPHQGQVTVAKALDYERTQRYLLTVVASEPELIIGADIEPPNPEPLESPLHKANVEEKKVKKYMDPIRGPSENLHLQNNITNVVQEEPTISNEYMKNINNEFVSEHSPSLYGINKFNHVVKEPEFIIGTDIEPPNLKPQESHLHKPNVENVKDEKIVQKVKELIVGPSEELALQNNITNIVQDESTISNENTKNVTEEFVSELSPALDEVNKVNHVIKEPELIIGTDIEPPNVEPQESHLHKPNVEEAKGEKIVQKDMEPIPGPSGEFPLRNNITNEESNISNERTKNTSKQFVSELSPALVEIKNFNPIIKKIAHLVDDSDFYKVNHNDVIVNEKNEQKHMKGSHEENHLEIPQESKRVIGTEYKNVSDIQFDFNKLSDPHLIPFLDSKMFSEVSRANHESGNIQTGLESVSARKVGPEMSDDQGKKVHLNKTEITEEPEIVVGTNIELKNSTNNEDTKLIKIPLNIVEKEMDNDLSKNQIVLEGNRTINIKEVTEGAPKVIKIHEYQHATNKTNSTLQPVQDFETHSKPSTKNPEAKEPELVFGVDFDDLNHNGSDVIKPLKVDPPEAEVARGNSSLGNKVNKTISEVNFHNLLHNSSLTKNISRPIFVTEDNLIRMLQDRTDRARNQTSRMSSTTTLTVNVKDDDDQDPSFIYQGCVVLDGSCINPEYQASVSSGVLAGVLSIHPEKIQAVDMDSLDTPIIYSFLSGSPDNFRDFFEINSATGVVRQVRPVDFSVAKKFNIIVKAEEASEGRRFATAKLVITVKPVDASPPVLSSSAKEGFVQENSPIGTRILDANAKPIRLSVTDADLGPEEPKPTYDFELTTTFFHVDPEGYLVVNVENLDRDPPSPGLFRFQVVAREKTGTAASSPLTLAVVLTDVNDNAPRLPMIPPISVQAGEGHREIANVTATDNDLGENAIISYSIYHVSNNGRNKFQIDPQSGVIESVGKLNAGEQYSITVQATDSGGKYSQTIVEVNVIPGPNTRSPVFKENTYEVTVSEGAPINSSVITITALDPEKEPVTYSIIAGNDLRQFGINDKTGVISVRRKLDREDLTRYQLLIKAEDEGGLSSTATVNIHVSDINDKNPEFIGEPYDWKVREGLVGAHVGVVEATDADEGMNANITYSVPDEVPFTINPQTGTVMTSTSLDYEKQKEYKFVVTAKDGAMEPRLATATVTVSVVDVEDEMPIFHKPLYEASVPENTPDYFVTQVTADDPDTTKAITYIMKQGPTELFSVDRHDGTIRTLRGLDFESEPEYDLVIGTLENNTTHKGSTTTVRVRVTDVNDIPPVFLTTSGPVPLDDNVSIGTIVTTLMATDSDGTAPGNKIRYEIVGRGKAIKYFQIDPDLGTVTVRDDLRKEADNEYQVDVKAYDLGEPQLSSVTSVPVFVRHVAVATPPIHLGFPDDSYTIQVPEDTKPGSLLKSFAVIASTSVQHIPLRCSIVKGNIDDLFFVNITGEKTCDLLLGNKQLDYEKRNEYQLKLKLDSLDDYINQNKSVTTVKIQVIDVNDNSPTFIYPSYTKLFKKDKYFGAVAKDKKEVRTVLQVKAEDKDSSGLTQLEYKLEPSEMNEYFSIDPSSGSIRTRRSVDSLPPDQLPVRLTVLVVDGKEAANTATAQVVINVIDESDWLILPIGKVAPESVSDKEAQISELLSQATGKLVGVERIGPLESTPDNITLNSDTTSTDLWLYFVDPETEKIIPINDTVLAKTVKDEDVIANITAEVTTALGGGILYPLHAPIKVRALRTAVVALDWEVFPYAVILIAGLILVLGTAGIVYICISWQRYKAYKERMQRMYVMPRYDPVFVEPNLKEYETQVLQMSVPMDDNDSYHDLQLDFSRKNHAFSLDNVSYITKDHGDNGGQSPTSSEAATTTRASSLGRHNNNNNIHQEGAINLSYDRSDDEMGHNSSPTNENVTFREKKDYSHLGFNYLMDRSPIETTTEL